MGEGFPVATGGVMRAKEGLFAEDQSDKAYFAMSSCSSFKAVIPKDAVADFKSGLILS